MTLAPGAKAFRQNLRQKITLKVVSPLSRPGTNFFTFQVEVFPLGDFFQNEPKKTL